MLSLPPAQGEEEGYPSRDLQCQGELSPSQPSIQSIKAARQTRHRNYRDTDRTLLRRDHQHVPGLSGSLLWLLWPHLIAVRATATHDTQCSSTAMQNAVQSLDRRGGFGFAFGLKSGMGRPRGAYCARTAARCHMPVTHCTHTGTPLHRRPLRSRLPGMVLQDHVAFRFRCALDCQAMPCPFPPLCPCPCLSPGSGTLLGRLAD